MKNTKPSPILKKINDLKGRLDALEDLQEDLAEDRISGDTPAVSAKLEHHEEVMGQILDAQAISSAVIDGIIICLEDYFKFLMPDQVFKENLEQAILKAMETKKESLSDGSTDEGEDAPPALVS